MTDVTGGVDPEIYRVYAKMLELNETCEKFVAATTTSVSAKKAKKEAAETVLSAELEAPTLD